MAAYADAPDELSIHKLFKNGATGSVEAVTFTGETLEGGRDRQFGDHVAPVGTAPGRTKLEIRADRLLLVEGRDDVNLFEAFIEDTLSSTDRTYR